MYKRLQITGLRGFSEKCEIEFAIPNGEQGSGLTILVGPNSAGKTTVTEAIQMFCFGYNRISIPEGKRNSSTGGNVEICMIDESETVWTIRTDRNGGSLTTVTKNGKQVNASNQSESPAPPYVLGSRRQAPYEFNYYQIERNDYLRNSFQNTSNRASQLQDYGARIVRMYEHYEEIEKYLKRILGPSIIWSVDQHENGQYFLKFGNGSTSHTVEGVGDGIWSVFTLCDSLYDAGENGTVVIDEPELSLHPVLQRKIADLLLEESRKKQIIVCTHSPYFVRWDALFNGGSLIRLAKEEGNCKAYGLSRETIDELRSESKNIFNPHALGLNACEIFFLQDGVIVCEGQDDVVIYRKILKQLGIDLPGDFFGWGAGGASRIPTILRLLNDLGYKKVCCIYDGDKEKEKRETQSRFTEYKFFIISANDVRDKDKVNARPPINGIAYKSGGLKDKFKAETECMFNQIKEYLEH